MSQHTAVWIDHQKAHVFRVEPESFTEAIVHAPEHTPRHPQHEASPHNHPDDEKRFFHEVALAVGNVDKVLIMGPAQAKLHFRDYVTEHASTLKLTVAGVETVDYPTDKQVAAFVRKFFDTSAAS